MIDMLAYEFRQPGSNTIDHESLMKNNSVHE